MSNSELLIEVENISRKVGAFLLGEQAKILTSEIEFKGRSNDMVSRADKEAEQQFVTFLEKVLPEAGFKAEEGTSTRTGKVFNWIIDPLDGTTNYLYGLPCFCTSVALEKYGELVLGVIYDPTRDECFTAEKGKGAFLNGKPIKVSQHTHLEQALVAMGFPYDGRGRQSEYLNILSSVISNSRGMRRLGSAALDMAYVACGRFDVFYEYGLHAWDCAAGAVLIREAGGKVSDFKNESEFLENQTILSDNGLLHEQMLGYLKDW